MVECVANFSEGRDKGVVAALAAAVGACLLDSTADPDHNRCVLTFAGEAEDVLEASVAAARVAVRQIDLRRHAGVHPRLGSVDVIPFVPIRSVTLADCAELACRAGERLWRELRLPVYLYEAAALRPECRKLEDVRRLAGQLPPDIGSGRHPSAGACVVGARRFLIAWNIELQSADLRAARAIAREIRESGGGLPAVKALGLSLKSKGRVQVSINLVDFERTPLYQVFEAVERCAARLNIKIEGSELIGMIPQLALEGSAGHDLRWLNLRPELVLENRLRVTDRN